jgi:carboxylesterase
VDLAVWRASGRIVTMVKRILNSVKSILFADPELLYKKDRPLLNQPFAFSGENEKAILLVHGWTSVPYEVRRLGVFLNESGYAVHAPMLRGHGTVPKDLEVIKWTDWLSDLQAEYLEMKKKYQKVYIGGTSIGSNLAVMLAKNNADVSGIILMAMPYKIKFEKLICYFAKLHLFFKKYNKKVYPPTFGVSTTITRLISYQAYPVASALETFELVRISRKCLGNISQPCLILQSTHDHVVSKKSAEKIYAKISSKIKKIRHIEKAYHTFISDIKNENVFQDILNFLDEN